MTHFDWGGFIINSPTYDKYRLIAEEKETEFYRACRVCREDGPAHIIEMMLHYFEDDEKLARKYEDFLMQRKIPHLYKDANVLLSFLNHLRWEAELLALNYG